MGRSKNNSALSNKNDLPAKNDTAMSKNQPNQNQNGKANLYDDEDEN